MKACLIAGAVLLAASTAQADYCAAMADKIERYEASIAEYEKAIEAHRIEHGFVDESPDDVYREGAEMVSELQRELERLQIERAYGERLIEEIERSRRAFEDEMEEGYEIELREVVQVLRSREASLKSNLDRLRQALAAVREVARELSMLRYKIEAQQQKLAEHITRRSGKRLQRRCDTEAAMPWGCCVRVLLQAE